MEEGLQLFPIPTLDGEEHDSHNFVHESILHNP
jgi:hypothetical protein